MSSETHWNAVYGSKASEDLGWYEPRPSTLELVLRHSTPSDPVIDIGSGDSRLVDELVLAGYRDLTMLDLSGEALGRAQQRVGAAERITWIQADVTKWTPGRSWGLWHDRAVFHFLTAEEDRQKYKSAALRALTAHGVIVLATFSLDGPEQCAGLPVERYDADRLTSLFSPELRLVEHRALFASEADVGDRRPYVAVVFKRAD